MPAPESYLDYLHYLPVPDIVSLEQCGIGAKVAEEDLVQRTESSTLDPSATIPDTPAP